MQQSVLDTVTTHQLDCFIFQQRYSVKYVLIRKCTTLTEVFEGITRQYILCYSIQFNSKFIQCHTSKTNQRRCGDD